MLGRHEPRKHLQAAPLDGIIVKTAAKLDATILDDPQPPARFSSPLPSTRAGGLQIGRKHAMTYGLSSLALIEDGPALQVAELDARRTTARSWRALDEARRLALIERAMSAANDAIDGYPIAI